MTSARASGLDFTATEGKGGYALGKRDLSYGLARRHLARDDLHQGVAQARAAQLEE